MDCMQSTPTRRGQAKDSIDNDPQNTVSRTRYKKAILIQHKYETPETKSFPAGESVENRAGQLSYRHHQKSTPQRVSRRSATVINHNAKGYDKYDPHPDYSYAQAYRYFRRAWSRNGSCAKFDLRSKRTSKEPGDMKTNTINTRLAKEPLLVFPIFDGVSTHHALFYDPRTFDTAQSAPEYKSMDPEECHKQQMQLSISMMEAGVDIHISSMRSILASLELLKSTYPRQVSWLHEDWKTVEWDHGCLKPSEASSECLRGSGEYGVDDETLGNSSTTDSIPSGRSYLAGSSIRPTIRIAFSSPATTAPSENADNIATLPCEFAWYGDCKSRFRIKEVDLWIEHYFKDHLRDQLPEKSACWFCDEHVFATGESSQDRKAIFTSRMRHIFNHIRSRTQRYGTIRPDFLFLEHLKRLGMVRNSIYRDKIVWNESLNAFLQPTEFLPPEHVKKAILDQKMAQDLEKSKKELEEKRLENERLRNNLYRATAENEKQGYWMEDILTKGRTMVSGLHRFLCSLTWPVLGHGDMRISWICKCRRPIYIDVKPEHVQQGIDIAHAMTSTPSSISVTSSSPTSATVTSNSSPTSRITSSAPTTPGSPSPNATIRRQVQFGTTVLAPGTQQYLLLCVNTGRFKIQLAHIDVTRTGSDEVLFRNIREAYKGLRGRLERNPFIVPKTVEYVKFELIRRHQSGECVGNYQTNQIPTIKEIRNREYDFAPCPPRVGNLPVQPHIFMHSLLYPGDHSGSLAVVQLPKKVGSRLACAAAPSGPGGPPFGWGIYIVEGVNTALVAFVLTAGLAGVFLVTALWTALLDDVQGGMGIGQFALAFMALVLTTGAVTQQSLNSDPSFGR